MAPIPLSVLTKQPTYRDVLPRLFTPRLGMLPKPKYTGKYFGSKVGLAVESMKRHTSSEGWELFLGLQQSGYTLHGLDIGPSLTDVKQILELENPSVVVVQDKREYEGLTADKGQAAKMRFHNVNRLNSLSHIFRGTILKDAHQRPDYHKTSAEEIGAHFWICYYHPTVVSHLAPYVRPEHIIRIYHSIDRLIVPEYTPIGRSGCVLSGAISSAYPLRSNLRKNLNQLPSTLYLEHPGYKSNGCHTPEYLKALSMFKVSICTTSMYAYALRKIVESSASGCIVLTDLPIEDKLPFIDDNLVRISPDTPVKVIGNILKELCDNYDPERQEYYCRLACNFYDYRESGVRLASQIETLRSNYA